MNEVFRMERDAKLGGGMEGAYLEEEGGIQEGRGG